MDREQDIPFIYEDGVLKPEAAVDLPEGTRGVARVRTANPDDVLAQHPLSTWQNRTLEELAREQGIVGPTNLESLRGDWPPEDSIDEFLAEVRKGRR